CTGFPAKPITDERLMMRPPRLRSIQRCARSCDSSNAAVTLSASAWSHFPRACFSARLSGATPAPFTTRSSGPSSPSTRSTAARPTGARARGELARVRPVRGRPARPHAHPLELLRQPLEPLAAPRHEADRRARLGERARDLCREPARRAGHQGDLAAQREELLERGHGRSTTLSTLSLWPAKIS